jgi:hypothetical protein
LDISILKQADLKKRWRQWITVYAVKAVVAVPAKVVTGVEEETEKIANDKAVATEDAVAETEDDLAADADEEMIKAAALNRNKL